MSPRPGLPAIALVIATLAASGCEKATQVSKAPATLTNRVVEASCGSCNFGLPGECALAIRVDGKAYPVDGASLDDYGDAHAADGMCNMIRQATITGTIDGDHVHATAFSLLPGESAPEPPMELPTETPAPTGG